MLITIIGVLFVISVCTGGWGGAKAKDLGIDSECNLFPEGSEERMVFLG